MADPTPVLMIIFGTPIAIVGIRSYFKALEKGVIGPRARALAQREEERKELEALREERKQLEARVQNLESIVCSVDLELNSRLNRLAAEQSRFGSFAANAPAQLPAGAPQDMGTAPTAAYFGQIQPGQTLAGRYKIERELGRGGMGAVFLARDTQLGELVALKVISPHLSGDPASAERFRREASAARKVTHPNVIRIYDIGEEQGILFLSMEFFSGMTLMELLVRRGPPPLAEARSILEQIADGLFAVHQAGIVHRDLKPQNVLINEARQIKLIDFGLAKSAFFHGMTATGLILGTPEYMAPEQIRGQAVDARSDVYAFGCVAYHLLCGVPPFRGDSPIAVGFLHCNQAPEPPRRLRPEIPEATEAALLKALSKEPSQRFVDMEEMKRALLQ